MNKNISIFNSCYGCGVCVNVCPMSIIQLILNEGGFYKPVIIDEKSCINCNKCVKVCAFNDDEVNSHVLSSYSGWSISEESRIASSSGGIAYEIASLLISKGYHILAVRYDSNNKRVEHYIATSINDLLASRGSKYLQSYLPDALSKLNKDQKYAVFGTPCQIHSLRKMFNLLHYNRDSVFIDFFCHGTPSYLMFEKYLKMHESIGNITNVSWRNKSNGGWHNSWNMIIEGEKGISCCSLKEHDLFYKFFLKNRCLNSACYDSCKYKMTSSAADIRIGDLWGTKYEDDELGVNGILVMNECGDIILKQLKSCNIFSESIEVVTESQMKNCATRVSSNKLVTYLLKTNISLRNLDRIASLLELIVDYIPSLIRRALNKLTR